MSLLTECGWLRVSRGVRRGLWLAVPLWLVAACLAQVESPFPPGYSMGNHGTIMWEDGLSGRQPWVPAAFYGDSLRFGVAVGGVEYFDQMESLRDRFIAHGIAGGWYAFGPATLKLGYRYFDALRVYQEHIGQVSLGTGAIPFVSVSVEARGRMARLLTENNERETVGEFGASVWVPRKYVALSVSVQHVTVKDAHRAGFAADPTVRLGLHTRRNRFGAQGLVCEVVAATEPVLRFMVGQEYWFHPMVGLCAALSTEPVMIGFGLTLNVRRFSSAVSFVHHPILGWSEGVMFEYVQGGG